MQRISRVSADSRKTVPKRPMIRGVSRRIPYTAEQGINSAHQGIKVPCSVENRDISRLTRSRSDTFRAGRDRNIRRKTDQCRFAYLDVALGKSRNVRDSTLAPPLPARPVERRASFDNPCGERVRVRGSANFNRVAPPLIRRCAPPLDKLGAGPSPRKAGRRDLVTCCRMARCGRASRRSSRRRPWRPRRSAAAPWPNPGR